MAKPGAISNQMIKYGTEKSCENLTKLFQRCTNEGTIQVEWKTSRISTIHMKSNGGDCDN